MKYGGHLIPGPFDLPLARPGQYLFSGTTLPDRTAHPRPRPAHLHPQVAPWIFSPRLHAAHQVRTSANPMHR
jgi:hypothetical protein